MQGWMRASGLLLASAALASFAGSAGSAEQRMREAWQAVADARGVQLVNVECGSGIFDPPEIVVEQGVPVELAMRSNEAGQEFVSGFTARGLVGRAPTLYRFTPQAQGNFEMACERAATPGAPAVRGRPGLLTVVPRRPAPQ